jgi:hypothetical protein
MRSRVAGRRYVPHPGAKRTLQDWEQGRRSPSGAAQALIRIAERHPEVVREVLV